MSGWIKVYRDIEEHWISKDLKKLGWWVYLLYKASYEDNQVVVGNRVIDVKRGQLVVSLQSLAERFGITKPTLVKFLSAMERQQMITRCVDQKITIITICNYDSYQGAREQQVTDSFPALNTESLPMSLLKGYPTKEDKEDKEYIYSSNPRTREDVLGWDAERENRYAATFKGQGTAIPLAKKIGKTPREVMNLLEIYMAHREVKNRGHKDYNEFLNLFMWHIENKKITMPEAAPKAQTQPKVITGQDIFNVYK